MITSSGKVIFYKKLKEQKAKEALCFFAFCSLNLFILQP
ncbi:hypothetical protein EfmE1679_2919 [Enterococcus faecium E1679]|nr:hypothetical protein EfmE1636_0746 [Enterococcus faecium E1636]EFF25074.1 hypothetical protein EfmE1679_2919 [Enterococcus faecium E1679]